MVNLKSFGAGALGGMSINIVIRAIDKYSSEIKKASGTFGKFKKIALLGVKTGAVAAAAGLTALGVASIKNAMRMEPMKRSFEDLTIGSQEFLESLKKATEGTVDSFNLMSAANRALLLGLDQEALPSLFKNAAIVGQAAGRTTKEAIDDITIGIGRQSRLILDNLGIIVKAEDAYNKYAISIGKTSSELSEAEKRTAFTKAAIKSLKDKASDLGGELEETATVGWQRFGAMLNDVGDEIGESFLPLSQDLTLALEENRDAFEEAGRAISNWVSEAVTGFRIVSRAIKEQKKSSTMGARGAGTFGSFIGILFKETKKFNKEQAEQHTMGMKILGMFRKSKKTLKDFKEEFPELKKHFKDMPFEIRKDIERIDEFRTTVQNTKTILEELNNTENISKETKEALRQKYDELTESAKKGEIGTTKYMMGLKKLKKEILTQIDVVNANAKATIEAEKKKQEAYQKSIQKLKDYKRSLAEAFGGAATKRTRSRAFEIASSISSKGLAVVHGSIKSARKVDSLQTGGFIEKGGLVNVHSGETILPATTSPMSKEAIVNIFANDAEDVADKVARILNEKLNAKISTFF